MEKHKEFDTMNNDRRQDYENARKADLTAYASMLGEEFQSRVDRLNKIIGGHHESSAGFYKESLLRQFLRRFLPKRYNVGTGFILFTKEGSFHKEAENNIDLLNLKEHDVSKQLDVIIYDDHNYRTIFSDGELVVIHPESVRAIVEVKGFVDPSQMRSALELYLDLATKWRAYDDYCTAYHKDKTNLPGLFIMAWNVAVSKDGKSRTNGQRIREQIVRFYKSKVRIVNLKPNTFPILNSMYIYNDCCINATFNIDDTDGMSFGYMTSRGKFVSYDNSKKPYLGGEKTVSELLASVFCHLETPFNPDISYFDQSLRDDLFPHKHQGYTAWLTGNDLSHIHSGPLLKVEERNDGKPQNE